MEEILRRPISGVLQIKSDPTGKVLHFSTMLTCYAFKEGSSWVAYCRDLDVASCGGTMEQAKRNLNEAIHGFFEACIKMGTLDKALKELGWKCRTKDNRLLDCTEARLPKTIPPPHIIDKFNHNLEWQMKVRIGGQKH